MLRALICIVLMIAIGLLVGCAAVNMVMTIVHVVFVSFMDMIRPLVHV